MKNRGQAALEFLTTYGWAFLVILVMIGAISYFGILNPGKLLPSKCAVSSEFSCEDYMITAPSSPVGVGQLKIQLKQGIGKTIYLNNVTCYYGEEPLHLVNEDLTQNIFMNSKMSWSPKNSYTFTCNLPYDSAVTSLKGQKAKVYFIINYQKSTATGSLTHIANGEVYAQVQ